MVPGLAPRSSSSVVTAAPSSLREGQGSRLGPSRGLWSGVLGVLEWRATGLQSTPRPHDQAHVQTHTHPSPTVGSKL